VFAVIRYIDSLPRSLSVHASSVSASSCSPYPFPYPYVEPVHPWLARLTERQRPRATGIVCVFVVSAVLHSQEEPLRLLRKEQSPWLALREVNSRIRARCCFARR
jgi:hypothetical protein